MQFIRINVIVLLLCVQIKSNLGQEALEVNTDYAEYKELREGQELELSCKNNVDPTQAVTWTSPSYVTDEKYTLDVKDRNVYTLTIKNAKREFAGKYICMSHARNGEKLIKDVHVGVKPRVKFLVDRQEIMDDSNNKINRTEKAMITCKEGDVSYPKPVREWKKNGELLEDETSEVFTVRETGTYTCKLANSIGDSSRTVYITIEICTESVICTIGLVFAIIGAIIIAIYLFINIFRDCIRDKEFTRNIKLIVTLVIVLIVLIALIIAHHSLECVMISLCIIEIICGILSVIIVAVDAYRHKRNNNQHANGML